MRWPVFSKECLEKHVFARGPATQFQTFQSSLFLAKNGRQNAMFCIFARHDGPDVFCFPSHKKEDILRRGWGCEEDDEDDDDDDDEEEEDRMRTRIKRMRCLCLSRLSGQE